MLKILQCNICAAIYMHINTSEHVIMYLKYVYWIYNVHGCIYIYMHIYIYTYIYYSIYVFIYLLILLEFNMMETGLYLEFAWLCRWLKSTTDSWNMTESQRFLFGLSQKTQVKDMPFPRRGHHRCGIFWAHFSGGGHQLPAFHSSFPVCSGCHLHFAAGIPLWIGWPWKPSWLSPGFAQWFFPSCVLHLCTEVATHFSGSFDLLQSIPGGFHVLTATFASHGSYRNWLAMADFGGFLGATRCCIPGFSDPFWGWRTFFCTTHFWFFTADGLGLG